MDTVITRKIKRLERVHRDEGKKIIVQEIIRERKLIVKMNQEQLAKGERSDGSTLPEYVPNSRAPKSPGIIKLFDEGDFYAGIEPLFDSEGITMLGLDRKTEILAGKYGAMILGLSSENITTLQEVVKPRVIQRIKNMI